MKGIAVSSRQTRKFGHRTLHALASVSMTALWMPQALLAQTASPSASSGVADIVVTARREAENIQNVPVSVKVVTGDTIQKLSITQASELSKLAPGLNLSGGGGENPKIVLRGVTWQPGSGTPATPIYFNEVPFDPQDTVQAIFDVGQVEVLRGPQGTSRGAPSISGAITITTRRPDLDSFGGYVQGMIGTGGRRNAQGAINVPLIKDVLAVRAAAFIEDSDGNRVHSVNSSIDPSSKTRVYRISALFQPTDTLLVGAMYQRRRQTTKYFNQVVGTGSPGSAAFGIPANFNGPALSVRDRKSVQDAPSIDRNYTDLLTANASWEIFGQKLSYNYGRGFAHKPFDRNSQDIGNMLPGYEPYLTTLNAGNPLFQTHEVRFSSISDPDRPFDYDIGWFQKHSNGAINVSVPIFLAPVVPAGAFGAPGTLPGVVTSPDPYYTLTANTRIALGQSFDSFYGNVRFYLGENTELSGGLAIVKDRVPVQLDLTTSAAAIVAAPLSALGGLPCAGIPGVFVTGLVDSKYAGFCDATIPASTSPSEIYNNKYSKALYNASLSHKFSEDLLVYATTGSSFRTGLPAIANTGLPSALLVPAPETAKSYEIGVKSSFGRRLRVNADIFQIDYKNQLTTFGGVPYFNSVSGTTNVTSIAFYRNIDSRVRGAELEIAAEPIDNLSFGVNLSYSKIASRGGLVPCAAGPAITAANPINFCASPKGQTLNTSAPFQATANGSYTVPFGPFDGYVRFNVNYQGHNPNYGNFPVAGNFTSNKAYAIVDLFAGLTGNKGGWDVGLYAKNLFNKRLALTRDLLLNNVYPAFAAADDGYDQVLVNPPREVGVTLRYAFGSR